MSELENLAAEYRVAYEWEVKLCKEMDGMENRRNELANLINDAADNSRRAIKKLLIEAEKQVGGK